MKKRYYFYIFIVLLIIFVAYNYYSAAQAEENITQLIQEQVDKSRESISIQYSSIDVSPFQGNIEFEDVNIIQSEAIRRAEKIKIDLNYYDFLKFSIGGTEYGIKHLSNALLILNDASYINRSTRTEIHFDELTVNYSGDLWNAILVYFSPRQINQTHEVVIMGKNASYHKPESFIGTFKADSLFINHTFSDEKETLSKFRLNDITWNPPKTFKQKYAFFIQGFGLSVDSILIDHTGFSYVVNERNIQINEGTFETSLLSAGFYGTIDKQPIAAFSPLHISITELSPRLQNALQNLKQLFDLSIPIGNGAIQFKLIGPVSDPQLIFEKKQAPL